MRAGASSAAVVLESQEDSRHRRRHWLRVTYDGRFDLAAEVEAIVSPLAAGVAALPGPLALRDQVEDLADSVHDLLTSVAGMLGRSSRLPAEAQARATAAVGDLAQRLADPRVTDEQIRAGSWAQVLVDYARPFSADLGRFLGGAIPPGTSGTSGQTASERLVTALRRVDAAALVLGRRIPKAAARQALGTIADANASARVARDAERARRALAGVERARAAGVERERVRAEQLASGVLRVVMA
jgi:hypothetical protein